MCGERVLAYLTGGIRNCAGSAVIRCDHPGRGTRTLRAPLLLLDRTLRIRGCNDAYERVSRRRREELIGQRVLDAFPDNPADPQANGTHNLQHSMDTAMSSGATHNMWVQRYAITDPPSPRPTSRRSGAPPILRSMTTTSSSGWFTGSKRSPDLNATLSVMAEAVDAGDAMSVTEQLHTLTAFSTALPADRQTQQALAAKTNNSDAH
jgi:hypothetical protein